MLLVLDFFNGFEEDPITSPPPRIKNCLLPRRLHRLRVPLKSSLPSNSLFLRFVPGFHIQIGRRHAMSQSRSERQGCQALRAGGPHRPVRPLCRDPRRWRHQARLPLLRPRRGHRGRLELGDIGLLALQVPQL